MITVILSFVRIVERNAQYANTRFVRIVFLAALNAKICSVNLMGVNAPIVVMWFALSIIIQPAVTAAKQPAQIAEEDAAVAMIFSARIVFGNAGCVPWLTV